MPLYNVADYLPEFVSAVADTGLEFKEAIQAIFDYHPETFSWEIINNPMFALGNFNTPGNYVIYDGAYHPKVCRAPADPSSIGEINDLVTPYCVSISETKNDDGTYTLIYAISQYDDILNIRKTSTGIDPDTKLPIYPDMNFSSDEVLHQSSRNYNLIYGNRTDDVSLIIPYGMDPIFAAPELTQDGTKETLIIERRAQNMGDPLQGFILWSNHGNVWTAIRFKDQMDLDIYDPNRKLKDVFKYSDDEMKAFDTQLADWTKHKANQLTLRHTDADMQKSFNDKLSQDAFAKMKTDKETSAKTLADSAFENILHFDQYGESKDTISESFDSHVASHVTAEDIAGWDSKADGDHVHKADDKTGVAISVGDSGTILRSTDNGLTWTTITGVVDGYLNWMHYSNNTYIVVGDGGIILRSTDDGLTWSQISGASGGLRGICYANNTWIAVGYGGTILRSIDDGLTWSQISGASGSLYGIYYSNNTWIAVGTGGTILRSIDDGLTWSKLDAGMDTLSGIYYSNNTWIVVGNGGTILRSTDNGLTWTKISSKLDYNLWGIYYSNNTWITVGSIGTILRSTDDGLTWTKITTSEERGIFNSIHCSNNTWIIVGNGGTILRSTDNGLTWSKIIVDNISNDLYNITTKLRSAVQIDASNVISGVIDKERMSEKVKMQKDLIPIYSLESLGVGVDKTHLHENQKLKMIPPATWIAGTVNAVHRSTDYGRSWTTITTTCLLPTFMRNNGTVWIMGDNQGHLYRSADDGLTWALVATIGTSYMHDMLFYNNTWLVTSAGGYIRKSADNGLTWTDYRVPNTDQGWISIDVNPTTNVVVVVGYNGYITRSADGGATFPMVRNPISASTLYAVKYLKDKLWIAAGDSGLIAKSTDDGLTWMKIVEYPNCGIIRYLDYHDGTIILSSNTGSQVIRSADDGLTWDAQPIGMIDNMYNIKYCVDGIWRIYLNGSIIESSDDGLTWKLATSYTGARSAYLADPLDDRFRYFYITDPTKIGTADYMKGLQEYTNRLGQDSEIEWSNIENKPTTLAGYGITDSYKKADFDIRIKNLTTDITTEKNKVSAMDTQLAEFDKLKYRYEYPYHFDPYADGGFIALTLNDPNAENPANSGLVPVASFLNNDKQVLLVPSSETVLFGAGNGMTRSTDDGLSWSKIAIGINCTIKSIACNNGIWIAVGQIDAFTGIMLRSTDRGLTWTKIEINLSNTGFNHIYCANNTWIAVGDYKCIFRSIDDGLTWTKVLSSSSYLNWIDRIMSAGNTWIGAYGSGIIRSTDDGLTWSEKSLTFNGKTWRLMSIYYGDNVWISVGVNGTITRSTDNGINWTTVTSGVTTSLWGITYCIGRWIVVGDDALVLYSDDNGVTWTKQTLEGVTVALRSVHYLDRVGLIGATGGKVIRFSIDGNAQISTGMSVMMSIAYDPYYRAPAIPHKYDKITNDKLDNYLQLYGGAVPPETGDRSQFVLDISRNIYGLNLESGTYRVLDSKYKGTIIGFSSPDSTNIELYTASPEPYSDSNIVWTAIPNSKYSINNTEGKLFNYGDIIYIPETNIVAYTYMIQDSLGERLIIAKMPNEKDGTSYQSIAMATSGSQKMSQLDTCRSYFIWGAYDSTSSASWILIIDTYEENYRLRPQYVIEDELIAISHSDTMWVCLCKNGIYTHPIGDDPEITPFVKIPLVLKNGSSINTTLHDIAYGNNIWMMVGTDETNFYIYKSWDSMKTWVLNTTISIEKIMADFGAHSVMDTNYVTISEEKASHAMIKFINYEWLCTVVLLKDTTYAEFNYSAYITNGIHWIPMYTRASTTYTDIHDNSTFLYGRDIRVLDWKGNHYSMQSLVDQEEKKLPNSDITMTFGGFAIKNEVDLNTPWIIAGYNGAIARSTDNGLNWTVINSGVSGYLWGLHYVNNTWIAAGYNGAIARSTDNGLTWTKITSGASNNLYGIYYANDIWITVGLNCTILRSTDDGLSWTKITVDGVNIAGINGGLWDIHYADNTWIAVGYSGIILRSTDDGLTWTQITVSGLSGYLYGIYYDNNTWIITGQNGTILRSTDDGLLWNKISVNGVSSNLSSIYYFNNTWLIVGSTGTILRSTDNGLTWSKINSGTNDVLRNIHYANNIWIITGNAGTILRSIDNGLNWTKISVSGLNDILYGVFAPPPYPVGYNPYTNKVYREIEGYKYIGAVNDYNAAAVDMIKESKKTIDALDLSEFK